MSDELFSQEKQPKMKQSFVAWLLFQRRIASMQSYFGYELTYVSSTFKNRLLKPLEYGLKAWQTVALFLRQQPQVIWIQLPPSPLLYLTCLYQVLWNRRVKIIADCHNATFRKPWIASPFVIQCLNRCDIVLVHNESVEKQALEFGISSELLFVLRDRSALLDCSQLKPQKTFSRPWILTPCSFSLDEPISEVLTAARHLPDFTFVMTGNPARAKGKHDLSNVPSNVKLTGFLPKTEFDALLCSADAVLGLTKLDGIQLSVAGEAVGVGKPMILSNTPLLRSLFYKGAAYVDPLAPEAIAQGCREALSRREQLSQEVCELREESDEQWLDQASKVRDLIERF